MSDEYCIMDARVAKCESILNYTFINKELCLEALQLAGGIPIFGGKCRMIYAGKTYWIPKNERLECLGDAVLTFVLAKLWYPTNTDEGYFNKMIKEPNVMNANLGSVGGMLGLDKCALLNQGTVYIGTKKIADIVEALIGAVMQDGDLAAAEKVIKTLGLVPQELLKGDGGVKSIL
ncbi:ribonuclease III [Lojkania enalia]|uniref:Ribonuclease III n=1 Tax=Lojkania enalia TaxID=147567 RepID=A0A9P4K0T5_9PLEO|nr:ribonuclease III [Didymosphaeria enalia]